MKGRGFAGQIAEIDLGGSPMKKWPLQEDLVRSTIGGFGTNASLALDYIPQRVEPLSPENVIILGAGTLSGTMVPGSARLAMTTKLPEVNAIFTASGSMGFACTLKYAGYDHIIIKGRSEKPVYLLIDDERVEIRDARDLWGKDLFETTDILRKRYTYASVIAIGQGGERLLPISLTLVDKIGSLGNKGGAAVFGSKNLKAVVVRGTGGIAVAEPGKFMKLIHESLKRVKRDPFHQKWVEQGIMSKWPTMDWSYRNRDDVFPGGEADKLVGLEVYLDHVKKGRLACPSCPYADKEILGVEEGEFKGLMTYSSGWARANEQFGILCQVGEYDKVVKCFDRVQRLGLCRHGVSATVDYAVYLYEQGVITQKDTGGKVLKRDFDTTMTLIDWMVSDHPMSHILGEGPAGMARAFGRERGELFETKGTTITDDPRLQGLHTMNFEFIVNPKGHHSHCWAPPFSKENPERFAAACRSLGIPEDALSRIMGSEVGFDVGRLTRYTEDWHALSGSLGLCQRLPYDGFWSLTDYRDLFYAATGIERTPHEMMASAERSWNLLRMLNIREGFDRSKDTYPSKWLQPLTRPNGEKASLYNKYDGRILKKADLERMIEGYYEERGWDTETGIPKKQKLRALDLQGFMADGTSRNIL